MANNDGITDMRIYELLCDVIHPSAFGYDFYYAPAKDSETHLNYKLEKNWMDKEKTDFISTAALYAASHGCGLIIEIFDHIDKYELQAMDNLDQCKKALQASQ